MVPFQKEPSTVLLILQNLLQVIPHLLAKVAGDIVSLQVAKIFQRVYSSIIRKLKGVAADALALDDLHNYHNNGRANPLLQIIPAQLILEKINRQNSFIGRKDRTIFENVPSPEDGSKYRSVIVEVVSIEQVHTVATCASMKLQSEYNVELLPINTCLKTRK